VEQLALITLVAFGSWLILAGMFMAVWPASALRVLSLTASTRTVNNVEQGLRLLAGLAMLLHSPASKVPQVFELGGWFIILSSMVLLIAPLGWHSAFAIWWANRLKPSAVRAVAPMSAIAGIGLIYAAF
jgi:hypothetical protein